MSWLECILNLFITYKVIPIVFIFGILIYGIDYYIRKRLIKKDLSKLISKIIYSIRLPLILCIVVLGISILLKYIVINLSINQIIAPDLIPGLNHLAITLLITWGLLRIINVTEAHYIKKNPAIASNIDICGTITKIIMAVISGMVIMDMAGVNISGIIAIGGIGSLALSLAGKDLLANFFGFTVIIFDRPFKVGDLISLTEKNISGVVEKVSWRVTTVMTSEKTPMYIPNSLFTTIVVKNETRMLARRISENLKFEYTKENQNKIDSFTAEVQNFLNLDTRLAQEFPPIFNIIKVGSCVIEISFIAFTKDKNLKIFMQVKQSILVEIAKIAQKFTLKELHPDLQIYVYENK